MANYFDKSFGEYKTGFQSRGELTLFSEKCNLVKCYIYLFCIKKASKVEDVLHTTGEVWLGLDKLHKLTSKGDYGLRITMTDFDAKRYMAFYDQFQVVFIFCVEYTIESIEDSGLYEIEQLGEVGKKMVFPPPLLRTKS